MKLIVFVVCLPYFFEKITMYASGILQERDMLSHILVRHFLNLDVEEFRTYFRTDEDIITSSRFYLNHQDQRDIRK